MHTHNYVTPALHSEIRLSKVLRTIYTFISPTSLSFACLFSRQTLSLLESISAVTWVLRGAKSSYEHSTVSFSNLVSTEKCCQPMFSSSEVQFWASFDSWAFLFGVQFFPSECQRLLLSPLGSIPCDVTALVENFRFPFKIVFVNAESQLALISREKNRLKCARLPGVDSKTYQ